MMKTKEPSREKEDVSRVLALRCIGPRRTLRAQ